MLVRLGQHIGFVTKPLVNFTPLSTRRFPTTLIVPIVLYSWSSVTISRTFGFVVGGGLFVGDGDGPAGVNAQIDASATNSVRSLRARMGGLRAGSDGPPYRAAPERSTQHARAPSRAEDARGTKRSSQDSTAASQRSGA